MRADFDHARQTGPALERAYHFVVWLVSTVEKFPRTCRSTRDRACGRSLRRARRPWRKCRRTAVPQHQTIPALIDRPRYAQLRVPKISTGRMR